MEQLSPCFFCGGDVPLGKEGRASPVVLDIPGASKNPELSRQLENYFVTRILLEMNSAFLEEQLLPEGGHPGGWFHLCGGCRQEEVQPAWTAYQKMVVAQAKIKEVRKRIRKRMEVKGQRRKQWGRLEAKIREQLFPDQSVKTEIDSDFEAVPESPAEDDFVAEDPPLSLKAEPPAPRKKRGRPPNPSAPPRPPKKVGRPRKHPPNPKRPPGSKRLSSRIYTKKPRPLPPVKPYHCTECPCQFKSPQYLTIHQQLHVRQQTPTSETLLCDKCHFVAMSPSELQRHMNQRHHHKHYRCPHCASFKGDKWAQYSAHLLSLHQDTLPEAEQDDLRNWCSECQRQFSNHAHLVLHRQKSHPEVYEIPVEGEPLQCGDCDQRFLYRGQLQLHRKSSHGPEKERRTQFKCPDCGKGFLNQTRLKRHKVSHTSKFKRDYVCAICPGMDYAYPEMLREHYKKCHPETPSEETGEQKMFKCRHCELTSPFKEVISRHLKTHKDKIGFICDECGNSYLRKDYLNKHKMLNHPKTDTSVPCPHCRIVFPNEEYRQVHIDRGNCKVFKESSATATT